MLVTSLINILEKYFSNSGDFLYQTEHHCHGKILCRIHEFLKLEQETVC